MGGMQGQIGVARSGAGSLVALVVAAAVIVGGVFVWTQADPALDRPSEAAAPAPSTTTTTKPEPARRVRMIANPPEGKLRVSEADLCALLDAEEVTEILELPRTATTGGEDRFYGQCSWNYRGTPVFQVDVNAFGSDDSTRESALARYLGFDIRHPDECPFTQALGGGCFRISKIPRLGEEAWATVVIATGYSGSPWAYDAIAFRSKGLDIQADVWQDFVGTDGPERALELLRLWESRLPATLEPVPNPCPPEGC